MDPLTQFLESLFGSSQNGKGTNVKFSCPLPGCSSRPSKLNGDFKLEVDIETVVVDGKSQNKWACWSCKNKGQSIFTLLKAVNAPEHVFTQLKEIIKYTDTRRPKNDSKAQFDGLLPKEYKSLSGKLPTKELRLRHAKAYIKKRGFTEDDILKYSVGYCEEGKYGGRIIIPSYDKVGKINFLVARTIYEDVKPKYLNPDGSRDIIPFELFINWEEPIVLCEGGFDVISIKRNVIPLLDKELQPKLMSAILGSKCKKVYLALDTDALKQVTKYAELLINEGKQVYTVDMGEYKDANQMGFEKFTRTIQSATRLTLSKLLKLKIKNG